MRYMHKGERHMRSLHKGESHMRCMHDETGSGTMQIVGIGWKSQRPHRIYRHVIVWRSLWPVLIGASAVPFIMIHTPPTLAWWKVHAVNINRD